MSENNPRITDDPLYQMLRDGKIKEFNQARDQGQTPDLSHCDFRGLRLRGMNARGLDMSGCYLRQADIRGIDFRETRLAGASIHSAKIAGAYFPAAISADEINLSLMHGTRMRYQD
jgi:uncharacterized protein YjbI with pentapeptide repeats